jgi:hypothetical protein
MDMSISGFSRCALSGCAAIIMLAACGGPQRAAGAGAIVPPSARSTSSGGDPWLYVGGSNNVVNAYDVAQPGEPLILSITQGIDNPAGLKVDDQGTLYVASPGNDTVAEYAFGQSVPAVTLSVDSAVDTAIDPRTGDLYVDTRADPPGIFVYKKGHLSRRDTYSASYSCFRLRCSSIRLGRCISPTIRPESL